eukprot:CAMPEP_0197941732 /NCGR_PEP_ID=MMETSP1439-20131203/123238_1 /TAXON_ID=66791 /ORGANISM="Gonyaulax spinifera, Strain CCMP409" /LENGTH=32 /DNA_ID= /DNA_START= /DNA_END= /DNA_ORIENTATION=
MAGYEDASELEEQKVARGKCGHRRLRRFQNST